MTTRQYIGARYVPVFADPVEWDNTRTYEHLMMVQHNGETFISQQAVPIGISLPDTEHGSESNDYWVHMSNWNAQVESYRQEVLQYNGRISTLENDLPTGDFDSTNTVKKYIDDAAAVVPVSDFDSTNTVKKYIDDKTGSIEEVLPITDFDSVNTVKAAIDGLQNSLNVAIESMEPILAKSHFIPFTSHAVTANTSVQGGCVNTDSNLLVYVVKDTGSNCVLRRINMSTGAASDSSQLTIGHGNSICYKDGYYYALGYNSDNNVYKINASDFSASSIAVLADSVVAIANLGTGFIGMTSDGRKLCIYDADFNLSRYVNVNNTHLVAVQDICADSRYVYCLFSAYSNSLNGYSAKVAAISIETGIVVSVMELQGKEEAEYIDLFDSDTFVIGYGHSYNFTDDSFKCPIRAFQPSIETIYSDDHGAKYTGQVYIQENYGSCLINGFDPNVPMKSINTFLNFFKPMNQTMFYFTGNYTHLIEIRGLQDCNILGIVSKDSNNPATLKAGARISDQSTLRIEHINFEGTGYSNSCIYIEAVTSLQMDSVSTNSSATYGLYLHSNKANMFGNCTFTPNNVRLLNSNYCLLSGTRPTNFYATGDSDSTINV